MNRHLAALSALFKAARKELQWITKNPVTDVSRRNESKGRERFLNDEERGALLEDARHGEALFASIRATRNSGN